MNDRCLRWRLLAVAHAPQGALAPVLDAALAWAVPSGPQEQLAAMGSVSIR